MAKKRTQADILNNLTSSALFNHYKNVAINTFKWDNLPEGIEERYLESILFDEGKILFFRDPEQSYMTLPCFNGRELDVYGQPLFWRAQGLNYNKEYDRDHCVLIENNKLRTPTRDMVTLYVYKMYQASRTMDVNLATSKIPFIITCDEKQVLTYKEILSKVDENEIAVLGAKGISFDGIQLLPTKPVFLGNDLMDFHRSVENQLLTYLGINNCPVDKKERLITDEAQSNEQQLEVNVEVMLEARKRAVEQINTMYNLEISVDLRHKPEEVKTDVSQDVSDGEHQANP